MDGAIRNLQKAESLFRERWAVTYKESSLTCMSAQGPGTGEHVGRWRRVSVFDVSVVRSCGADLLLLMSCMLLILGDFG